MNITSTAALLALALSLPCCAADPAKPASPAVTPGAAAAPGNPIADYAELVHRAYADAHAAAVKMQAAVDAFLAAPSSKTLLAAKSAWLAARNPYSLTEAFRYYEGPIDAEGGPEGQLNAWPLNEAYIDYVKGNDKAGIIADASLKLDEAALVSKNAKDDEADVTTGFHAIEFLLWGQDLSPDSAGTRSHEDYAKGDATRERRRTYLKLVTDLVVKDLKSMVDAWNPKSAESYGSKFRKLERKEAVGKILTGLATLSGFELAAERIGAPLDSGSQENEQSCFSDNTHNDLKYNCQGIADAYLGTHGSFKGAGINKLVDAVDPSLNKKIEDQLKTTQTLANALDFPIDRVLASPKGSASRKKMEDLVKSLQIQADLFKQAGAKLGAEVVIKAE